MKNLKEKKYLLLDLDGVCYGKHNNYSLEKVFGQVSQRMTMFISDRLKIDKEAAKELEEMLLDKISPYTSLQQKILDSNNCPLLSYGLSRISHYYLSKHEYFYIKW